MANLFKRRRYIKQPVVDILLSESLWDIVDHESLEKVIKQINKLPSEIPKIRWITFETGAPLENTLNAKVAKTRQMVNKSSRTDVMQIHVAYEPGEDYSLRNTVGAVFASNAGLILLNDVSIKQKARDPINPIYLVNLILHEIAHVYGLEHAAGISFFKKGKPILRNNPVMNAGKFGLLGMTHDDIAGLRENYNVPQRQRTCLTVNTTASSVGLINKDKKKLSQGKWVIKGQAIFPQLVKGKYIVYLDGKKAKTVTVHNDKEITI